MINVERADIDLVKGVIEMVAQKRKVSESGAELGF